MRKKAEGRVVFNLDEWKEKKSEIKDLIKSGASLSFLGRKYGVSRQRMSQVLQQIDRVEVWESARKVGNNG